MNLHPIKAVAPLDFVDHRRVRHMRTHQGQWTARMLRRRNEAEGGHLEHLWIMPSIVRHSPVVSQDRQLCHLQFKGTFIQV